MKGILLTTLNAKYIHMNLAIRLLYELNQLLVLNYVNSLINIFKCFQLLINEQLY